MARAAVLGGATQAAEDLVFAVARVPLSLSSELGVGTTVRLEFAAA